MIQVVCFSRDRPLQLHGYLRSLFEQWTGTFSVAVLARVEQPYTDAYREVHLEFPKVIWKDETTDFAVDVRDLIDPDVEYICFGCDDGVWIKSVDAGLIATAFQRFPDLLAFSLRLGANVQASMFLGPQAQPEFTASGVLTWPVGDPHTDWGYPWEFNGTVHRTSLVRRLLYASSPNLLEDYGARHWSEQTDKRLMACYPSARLVVPTVNRVQADFANPICGSVPLSPEFLLECWKAGLRLDIRRFASVDFLSVHVPEFYLRRV